MDKNVTLGTSGHPLGQDLQSDKKCHTGDICHPLEQDCQEEKAVCIVSTLACPTPEIGMSHPCTVSLCQNLASAEEHWIHCEWVGGWVGGLLKM